MSKVDWPWIVSMLALALVLFMLPPAEAARKPRCVNQIDWSVWRDGNRCEITTYGWQKEGCLNAWFRDFENGRSYQGCIFLRTRNRKATACTIRKPPSTDWISTNFGLFASQGTRLHVKRAVLKLDNGARCDARRKD